ncbi:MAG: glycosyltransferase [Isosphaeraceae bacterium]
MIPRVEVLLSNETNLYHFSMINTGLVSLADRGAIDLRYRAPRGGEENRLVADPLAVCLFVRDSPTDRPLLLVIDLHDQGDVFAPAALGRCDAYFKRSFHPAANRRLDENQNEKVRPFGLNFACRSPGSTGRLMAAIGPRLALQGPRGWKKIRYFLALPFLGDYEQPPDVPVEPTVVFQTRVWEAHEAADGEAERLNRDRVEVIRALKGAFGGRYRGGLMPTPLALREYPDEVSPHPARRRLYTAMSKKNLIGVYTAGLFESTAFKLPEYLAASQCIVAETPRNGLPSPLVDGEHYLSFRTASECVAACRRLLEDRELARSMRLANWSYYQAEVAPAARLESMINQARPAPSAA